MKIIKTICQLGQLNVSDIVRRINLIFTATLNHLKLLESEGVLSVWVYGRVHLYRLGDSKKAKAVVALVEAWTNTS